MIHTDFFRRSNSIMDGIFYTLQNFLTHTEATTYLIIIAVLLGMLGFWNFLTDRDEEIYKDS